MAIPKLALIPAAQGDKFYSLLPSDGLGDFTFTRGSSATRINAQGLIETVSDTSSRLNYDLLNGKVDSCPHYILEPSSTNLITYSEDFSNSIWIKSNASITANQIVSPDGGLNADLLTSSSGSSLHSVNNNTSQTVTVGDNITLSVFAKKGTYSIIQLTSSTFYSIYANFDLENGVVGSYSSTNASIENLGNDWYRCSFTDTVIGTANSRIQINIVENLQSIRNSNFDAVGNETVYLWGAMVENKTFKTSYIPTTTTIITRAAETATDSGDSELFNDSQGVLYIESKSFDNTIALNRKIVLGDGTLSNGVEFSYQTTTNKIQFIIRAGGSISLGIETTAFDVTEFTKIAIQYKLNEGKVFVNGNQIGATYTNIVSPTINRLDLKFGSGFNFEGKVKEIRVYNEALTDVELASLTTI